MPSTKAAKRKKKKSAAKIDEATRQEIAEEILALEAIYAEDFQLHQDELGFSLRVVPYTSEQDNFTSVELNIRYTAGYPSVPLQLRLVNTTGLAADDTKQLVHQLNDSAASFAKQATVCVFNLVDECQEFLREHNEAAQKAAAAAALAEQQELEAAAAAAGTGGSGVQSLWHEMQQRMQKQAAEREAEVSVGPGTPPASLSSNVLGEDLWMFDGGLFAEEGEPSFAVPNLATPGPMHAGKAKRFNPKVAARADLSPDPTSRFRGFGNSPDIATASPRTPSYMDKAGYAVGKSPRANKAAASIRGGLASPTHAALKASAVAAVAGKGAQQHASLAQVRAQQPQQQQPPHAQEDKEQQQLPPQLASTAQHEKLQKLLLPHRHSCSFSNLPKGLQQLLNNSSRRSSKSSKSSKKSRQKHKHTQHAEQQQQYQEPAEGVATAPAGAAAAAGAVPATSRLPAIVFGDFDSKTYKNLSDSGSKAQISRKESSNSGRRNAAAAAVAAEVLQTCMSDSEGSEDSAADDSNSEAQSSANSGETSSESGSEEEEGVSLRSQLLLGYLLMLAAGGGPAAAAVSAGTDSTSLAATTSSVGAGAGATAGSSALTAASTTMGSSVSCITGAGASILPPMSLPLLANHLRQAGLLPKWVHWLLQQLPQRPELFDRAFNRLFHQEIQDCCKPEALPKPSPGQLLQLFWDRQAQLTAAEAAASAAHEAAAAGPARTTSAAAVEATTAAVTVAAGATVQGQQQQMLSRYRSDFQELNPLGRGGFGVVVAAINRLDGRKYAVKKIKLQPGGGSGSYSRILREVATLSRLQHPNVVRYFQAWTELAFDDADADLSDESEGEWGKLSDDESSSYTASSESYNDSQNDNNDSSLQPAALHIPDDLGRLGDESSGGQWATPNGSSGSSEAESEAELSSSSSSSSRSSSDDDGMFGEPSFSIPPHLPEAKQQLVERGTANFAGKPPAGAAKGNCNQDKKAGGTSSGQRRGRSGTSAAPAQILYIQMEFCPRTLSQVLEAGAMDEADAWLVLRGILAALAYIHSQGAIHRDLKPANIFYDSKGEIKLGDFGLAKFNSSSAAAAAAAEDSGAAGAAAAGQDKSPKAGHRRLSSTGPLGASATGPSDLTGVCGTGFYISPEIAQGWASYDEKVDLYSLGVVVFEMWHPFSTAMERVVLLRELRESGRLPPAWEAAHPQVARLIRWLMKAKPSERPSAREVLQSDILPPRVEDEQLKDVLRSLPDNPIAYERVVDALFSISNTKEQQQVLPGLLRSGSSTAAAAAGGGVSSEVAESGLMGSGMLPAQQGVLPLSELPGAPLDCHLDLEEAVCKVVKDVCSVHGAVQMSSTSLGLSHVALPKDAVRLLAPSGAQVALRYEVRYPFAAWYAQQAALAAAGPYGVMAVGGLGHHATSLTGALERGMKRFELCKVQRQGRGSRGLPATYLQADFDVLVPSVAGAGLRERMLAEAEVIKVVTQVLDAVPELGPYEIRLGHTQLFTAAVQGMCLPPEITPASVMAQLAPAISTSAAHADSGTAGHSSGTVGGTGVSNSGTSSASAAAGAAAGSGVAGGAAAAGGNGGSSCSAVTGGRANMWPAVRVSLDGLGLDSKPVSRCRQCVLKLPGPVSSQQSALRSYLRELKTQLGSAGLSAALQAAEELAEVAKLLQAWGLHQGQILLEPLLTPHSEHFGGVLFQVLLQSSPSHSGTIHTSAVAAGGRYDGLLRSLWSPAAASLMPSPGAVGVSINCEKLVKMLLQRRRHRAGPGHGHGATAGLAGGLELEGGRLPAGQCDVLVCSKGGDGMLRVRMELLAQLWAAGISATLVPKEAPSLTEQYEYAHGTGARWLVILDEKTLGPSQTVRVKSLERERKEMDSLIHIHDLGRFLQLGLSGAQDPGRGIASAMVQGSGTSAFGHWGGLSSGVLGSMSSAGSGSGAGMVGVGGGLSLGHRVLHRSGSDTRLGGTGDSTDAEIAESAGGREGGRERDKEQGGKHRDRRR